MDANFVRANPDPLPRWQSRWAKGLFWGWNIIFLAFMVLGFAPRLIPELVAAIQSKMITPLFLIYAVVLSLVPPATMLLAYLTIRRDAYRLFSLGYVVEGPLMLMLAVRFFAIRQGSSALSFLMVIACLGMAAFVWELIDRKPRERSRIVIWLRLAGLTLMLIVAIYAAVWIAFYALPGAMMMLEIIDSSISNISQLFENPLWLPFSVLGFILLVLTSSLFILAPIAVPVLTYYSWRRALRITNFKLSRAASWITVASISFVSIFAFVLSNRQPQIQAYALLASPPESPEAAAQLMKHEKLLRKGLLNAYLAPFRYISSLGEVGHIRDLYTGIAGFSLNASLRVEKVYEFFARPVLYVPISSAAGQVLQPGTPSFAMEREPLDAARLYQRVFDETIVEAERSEIINAARSTWDRSRAEDALQVVEEKTVHLEQQDIAVIEHGDWAEIELHEVYRNTTAQRQEVIYYFNLPETAVITGVWLGSSDNRDSRYEYIIAPRGAAQAVYREQVRRSLDPALVEQIGPRQYRLRIFPIEPIQMHFDSQRDRWMNGEAPPLHLWLTWKVLASGDHWPMPQLALKHNIFWDEETLRSYNDYSVYSEFEPSGDKSWLPVGLTAKVQPIPVSHRVGLPGGVTVSAEPVDSGEEFHLPQNLKLALVIDRSRSMEPHAELMQAAIDELRSLPLSNIDVYLSASKYRGEGPSIIAFNDLDSERLLYLGGQNPAELLDQFESLRNEREYSAVLVVTDATGYELGQSYYSIEVPKYPVWFIHLGDKVPLGYDDATLAAIQGSSGGVAGSIKEALKRIAAAGEYSQTANGSSTGYDFVDGYRWTAIQGETGTYSDLLVDDPGFASLAARRAILSESQRHAASLDDLSILDMLHSWAHEYGIVTPYSSMIVLVNQEQKQLLEDLSHLDDRFQREVESLAETTTATETPIVGVPEPEEWLLIGITLILLLYIAASRGLLRPDRLFTSSGKL